MICAFIQMFNEVEKGNLRRCLENVRQWADEIVIYDDGSTDSSVEVASEYTSHIIRGKENDVFRELYHKQELLEYALKLDPDWIMWIDCDEILDRRATSGGLRELAESAPGNCHAYSFHQLNLWRGERYCRTDTLFNQGWFCRLWRVSEDMHFLCIPGVHNRIYPINIQPQHVYRAGFRVIHYGFSEYAKVMQKIGVANYDTETLRRVAENNWILNESECSCYYVEDDVFPPENVPEGHFEEPKPRLIELMSVHAHLGEVCSEMNGMSLTRCQRWWEDKVSNGYFTVQEFGFSVPEAIIQFELRDKRILEIGPGYGRETKEFAKLSDKVTVVDVSRAAIELTQENVPGVAGCVYDGVHLPFEASSFDFVYSCFVIQHMGKAAARGLLEEICRVKGKKGSALIEFYSGAYEAGPGRDHYSGTPENGMFNNGYTLQEIRSVFSELGIEIFWVHTREVQEDGLNLKNHFVCF